MARGEITQNAYEDIREEYIKDNYNLMEILDDEDNVVLTLEISDNRLSWNHTTGDNPMELTAVLSGSDEEITLPQKISKSVIKKNDESITVSERLTADFEFQEEEDELTIRHKLEIPEIE